MEEISLSDYAEIWNRRKLTIVLTAVLSIVFTGVALLLMPRTYVAETSLLLPEQNQINVGAQFAQLAGFAMPGITQSVSSQGVYISVLKSRVISDRVCSRLKLAQYGLDYKDLQKRMLVETPKEGGLLVSCRVPTSWLRPYCDSEEISKRTARLAADVANAYILELREYDRSNSLFLGRQNRVLIERQMHRARAELSAAEDRLQSFQEAHPRLVPPDKSVIYAERGMQLATEETAAAVLLQETQAQLEQSRATWNLGAPEGVSPEAVVDNPTISQLRTRLAALEVERTNLLEDFTEAHPAVVSADRQIRTMRDKLEGEVSRVIAGAAGSETPAHSELLRQLVLLQINREGLQARIGAISRATAELDSALMSLPAEEKEYARRIRDAKSAEAVYTTLLAEHAKARVAEGREGGNFIVLDQAVPPELPAGPRVKLALLVALLAGLALGTLIATAQGITPRQKASS